MKKETRTEIPANEFLELLDSLAEAAAELDQRVAALEEHINEEPDNGGE